MSIMNVNILLTHLNGFVFTSMIYEIILGDIKEMTSSAGWTRSTEFYCLLTGNNFKCWSNASNQYAMDYGY